MNLAVSKQNLSHDGCILIVGLDEKLTFEPGTGQSDGFLVANSSSNNSRLVFSLGQFPALERYTLCHRYEPYWMKPQAGSRISDVPPETQFLLAKLKNGHWLLCVPLLDEPFRFSLRGRDDQHLEILAETGDPYTVGAGGVALYVAYGDDPFHMVKEGAKRVSERLGWGRLRTEKPLPGFVDTFGWCTWDAFYQEVGADKVREGLSTFAKGGIAPKFLILDDGWQSAVRQRTGEDRLVAFEANQKFPEGLASMVSTFKRDFGLETFLVWHAVVGYWGGVSDAHLPGYGVKDQLRRFGEGIMAHVPKFNEQWWGSLVGFVSPDKIAKFYDDFHSYLQSQGVDGVKVDSQAVLEGISYGYGGRVSVNRAYREGLEKSAERHFEGRLINCMSNAQETYYGSVSSTLIRSSIDFFPRDPLSHGLHLYANAQVGLWFGEFMHPDWDMFQSEHEWGAYHAAARAISGGPVYVSDKPGAHDFQLLRKLVCTDGRVLRCDQPALPTLDVLCFDPTNEDTPLKIWNCNGNSGVIGIFSAKAKTDARSITTYKPSDVRTLHGDSFACYSHNRQTVERLNLNDERCIELPTRGFELVTIVPINDGFAPIGLTDKFNSAAAIATTRWLQGRTCEIVLKDCGTFLAYSAERPTSVRVNGAPWPFELEPATHALRITLPTPGQNRIEVAF